VEDRKGDRPPDGIFKVRFLRTFAVENRNDPQKTHDWDNEVVNLVMPLLLDHQICGWPYSEELPGGSALQIEVQIESPRG